MKTIEREIINGQKVYAYMVFCLQVKIGNEKPYLKVFETAEDRNAYAAEIEKIGNYEMTRFQHWISPNSPLNEELNRIY